MRTFWKPLTITLLVTCFVSGALVISDWWPNIPSAPRPAEGRIYPLNNHAHNKYMNRSEFLLQKWILSDFPLVVLALGAIQCLADPFGELRRGAFRVGPQIFDFHGSNVESATRLRFRSWAWMSWEECKTFGVL
jgi:hypothetical protein